MLKIRLAKTGKKHEPHYRIVVAEARSKRDGKYTDELGYYNPRTNPSTIKLDKEKAQKWLSVGAKPTNTVKGILIKEGILEKDYIETKESKAKKDKKESKTKASKKK